MVYCLPNPWGLVAERGAFTVSTMIFKLQGTHHGIFRQVEGDGQRVTGGAATVTIELGQACVFPGEPVKVKVTATSTGAELKSKGCYVDVYAEEKCSLKDDNNNVISKSKTTVKQEVLIAAEFVLAANETKVFEGTVTIPTNTPPTFIGTYAQHTCALRGRIEAFGNDPDSGYKDIMVGSRG